MCINIISCCAHTWQLCHSCGLAAAYFYGLFYILWNSLLHPVYLELLQVYGWQWYKACLDYVDAVLKDGRAFRVAVLSNPNRSPVHLRSIRALPREVLLYVSTFLSVPLLNAIHGFIDPVWIFPEMQSLKDDLLEKDYKIGYEMM